MAEPLRESPRARRWFQLRLSTLLLLVMIAALSAGWFADRRRLQEEIESLQRKTAVISLSYLSADDAAGVLKDLAGTSSEFVLGSDTRSNSIVVRGSAEDIESVKAVLRQLDTNLAPPPAQR
jgi:type II secretory pathway component GspD/PulD (secretin)